MIFKSPHIGVEQWQPNGWKEWWQQPSLFCSRIQLAKVAQQSACCVGTGQAVNYWA
jgi:hypothetical protein